MKKGHENNIYNWSKVILKIRIYWGEECQNNNGITNNAMINSNIHITLHSFTHNNSMYGNGTDYHKEFEEKRYRNND